MGGSYPFSLAIWSPAPQAFLSQVPPCWQGLWKRAASGSGWLLADVDGIGSVVSGETPGLGPDGLSEFLEGLLAYFRDRTSGEAELGSK